jgi:hypothetical protein
MPELVEAGVVAEEAVADDGEQRRLGAGREVADDVAADHVPVEQLPRLEPRAPLVAVLG